MSQQSIAVILWLNTEQVKFDSEIIYWNKDMAHLQGCAAPARRALAGYCSINISCAVQQ